MKYRVKTWEELVMDERFFTHFSRYNNGFDDIGNVVDYGIREKFEDCIRGLRECTIDELGHNEFERISMDVEEWMVDEIGSYVNLSDEDIIATSENYMKDYLGQWEYENGNVFGDLTKNKIGDDEEMYSEKGLVRRVKDINEGNLIIVDELVDVVGICEKDREVFLKDGNCLGNVITMRMNNESMLIGWEGVDPTVKVIDTREEYCEWCGLREELANKKDYGLISKDEFNEQWSKNVEKYKDVSPIVRYELVWE